MKRRLTVIGGGAAGFFCAVNAARLDPSLQVTILEKSSKLLSKVRISGGGRCNVTHAIFDIGEMSRRYPRGQNFVKKAFHQFFTTDTIQWFEERGVRLKAEADGRMFPVTDSSETIIHCLMAEANARGVEIRMNAEVKGIRPLPQGFELILNGSLLQADRVCIACGGYPKAAMFQWLQQLGHTISEPVPSLFTFNLPQHPITQLMGVSVDEVRVKIGGSKLVEQGPVLITHWGLSGPAVLRLSAWGARELSERGYDFRVQIHWLPSMSESELRDRLRVLRQAHPSRKIANQNFPGIPARLWNFLLQQSGVGEDLRFSDLPSRMENALVRSLTDYTVDVKGKTTYKEEFVTAGGIQLSEVNPQSMESRKIPGLYFAGEILDVDGITGGFNFQHAWTSGYLAAKAVAGAASDQS